MPIKIFSDLDFKKTQLKDVRLDNITDENLLTGLGEIAFDTSSDNIKYKDSVGISSIASQDWVLSQSFGVNLLNGNGTTFVDYGTAGTVNLGGNLSDNVTLDGLNLYSLNLNNLNGVNIIDDAGSINITSNSGGININETGGSDVVIDVTAGGGFYAYSSNSGIDVSGTSAFLYGQRGTFQINGSNLDIISKDSGNIVRTRIRMSDTETTFYDTRTGPQKGIEYAANYSSNYTNRSLVDREYVITQIASNAKTFSNGSGTTFVDYGTAGTFNLGGALSQNTTISGNYQVEFSRAMSLVEDYALKSRGRVLIGIDTGAGTTGALQINTNTPNITDAINVAAGNALKFNVDTNGTTTIGTDIKIGRYTAALAGTGIQLGNYGVNEFTHIYDRTLRLSPYGTNYDNYPVLIGNVTAFNNYKLQLDGGLYANAGTSGNALYFDNSQFLFNVPSHNANFKIENSGRITAITGSNSLMHSITHNNSVNVGGIMHFQGVEGYVRIGGGTVQQFANVNYPATTNYTNTSSDYFRGVSTNTTSIAPSTPRHELGQHPLYGSGGSWEYGLYEFDGTVRNPVWMVTTSTKLFAIGLRTATSKLHVKGNGTSSGELFRLDDNNNVNRVLVLDNGNFTANAGTAGESVIQLTVLGATFNKPAKYLQDYSSSYDDRSLVDKAYVDAIAQGLDPKQSVRVATTGFITLSGLQTIDGVTLQLGDRVLVKDQGTAGVANGIYNASTAGWSRSTDFDGTPANEVTAGAYFFVTEGSTYQDTGWTLATNDPITLGSTALVFTQFSSAGTVTASNGLTKVGPDVQMGGSFTQNTNINGNNFDTSFGVSGNTLNTFKTYSSVLQLDAATLRLGTLAGITTGSVGSNTISIGTSSNSGTLNIGTDSIAIGTNTNAIGNSAIAIGNTAKGGSGINGVSIGNNAGNTSGTYGNNWISLGFNANIGTTQIGNDSVAVGSGSKSIGTSTVAIGQNAGNTTGLSFINSISIGVNSNQGSTDIGQSSVAIGNASKSISTESISMGTLAGATTGTVGTRAISIGYNSNGGTLNVGASSVAVGPDTHSTATNSLALGNGANATATSSIAIGETAFATATANISIGLSAGNTSGTVNVNAIAIGNSANAGTGDIGNQSIAIGTSALARGQGNVAIGGGAEAKSFTSIAIGQNAGNGSTDGSEVVTIGPGANSGAITTGQRSIAIGSSSRSIGSYDVTIGYNAAVTTGSYGGNAITIGQAANTGTSNVGANGIAIGGSSKSVGSNTVAIGSSALSTGINSVALGLSANSSNDNTVAIGAGTTVSGVEAIGIGSNTKTLSDNSIAIGRYAGNTSGTYNTFAISIGYNANQGTANIGGGSIALGTAARSKGNQSISIGTSAGTTSGADNQTSISFGYYSNSGTETIGGNSIAIGANTVSAADDAITIGNGAKSLTGGSANITIGVAAGFTTGTTGANAISMGYQANTGTYNIGANSIALGNLAKATNNANVSIGYLAGNNSGSIGASVITIGPSANAGSFGIGANSITIGQNANVRTQYGIAIGEDSLVNGGSVAVGRSAQATNANSVAIGTSSVASGSVSTAVGAAVASGGNDVAIGIANVSGLRSIGIGSGSGGIVTTSDFSIVIGADITSHTGTLNIGIGYGVVQTGNNSVALGNSTKANAATAIAIGDLAGNTTGTYNSGAISIGSSANQGTSVIGQSSISIGVSSKSTNSNNISIGSLAGNTTGTVGVNAISIGPNANQGTSNIGQSSVAIGDGADATQASAIAIGQAAVSSGANTSITLGTSSTATADSTISIGHVSNATGQFATAIGRGARAQSLDTISIGTQAGNTTGTYGNSIIAIGRSANGDPGDTTNYGANSIAIGLQSRTKGSEGIAMGYNAGFTTGTVGVETISIGYNANAGSFGVGLRSIAIGSGAKSQTNQTIAIGYNSGNTSGVDGGSSISIGAGANNGTNNVGAGSIAIGQSTKSLGDGSIAIGTNVQITQTGSAIAIGASASVPGGGSGVAVGSNAVAAVEGTGIGTSAIANANSSTAIGFSSANTSGSKGTRFTALGAYAGRTLAATNALGADSVSVGPFAVATQTYGISIGYQALANSTESIAIGLNATTDNTGSGTLAIGTGTSAVGGGIAIGRNTTSNGGSALAIGNSARANNSGIAIGQGAGVTSGTINQEGISIGINANSGSTNIGTRSIAIGNTNKSEGSYSVAIGGQTLRTTGTGAMMMGYSNTEAVNAVDYSFGLVWQDALPEYHIVKSAQATVNNTPLVLNSYALADDNVYHMKYTVLAVQTNYGSAGGTDRASFTFEALAYRAAGSGATLEGGTTFNITEIKSANATPWTATIDVSGNNVRTIVTGVNGENINWKVMLHVTRVN